MKILQTPITPNHKSAMFFDGVIAEFNPPRGNFKLETFQDGEIIFEGMTWTGTEIIAAGKENLLTDEDIENESDISILVDKFITITFNDKPIDVDYLMFDNYDDAITAFKSIVGE